LRAARQQSARNDRVDALASFVRGAAVVMLTGGGAGDLAVEAFARRARLRAQDHLNRNMLERIVSREIERRRSSSICTTRSGLARRPEARGRSGQLAAGVAHEINTPAQYVDGNITFLAERFATFMPLLEALRERIAAAPAMRTACGSSPTKRISIFSSKRSPRRSRSRPSAWATSRRSSRR
jgi:signal transduction histidine kinase